MSQHASKPEPNRSGRRRSLTTLTAMGSHTLAAGEDAEIGNEEVTKVIAAPYPDTTAVLGNRAFDRSDITEGKPGIPLTLTLTIVDEANGRRPIANANVEMWHCDADGVYSEYARNTNACATGTTYLRGVQTTDDAGQVMFSTIYPGWSSPRAAHICVQIYNGTTLKKVLELGFPDAINAAVHGTTLYIKGQSPTANDADEVFGNVAGNGAYGGRREFKIAAIAGDNTKGYVGALPIAVKRFA